VLLLSIVTLPILAQKQLSGPEGHPPGQGRPADSGDVRYFGIRIVNENDRTFRFHLVRETPRRERPNKTPGGGGNWKPVLTGFDAKLVRFTDSTVVPLKPGRTPLVIAYPQYRDTVGLVIEKVGRTLVVDFDRPALDRARRRKLYSVSTWDTAGGAAREKAVGSVTVGMPIDQAKSLLGSAIRLRSSEYPETLVYAIDTRQRIYLQEKEGRVAKIWIATASPGVIDMPDLLE
jgi:hypothetical protein